MSSYLTWVQSLDSSGDRMSPRRAVPISDTSFPTLNPGRSPAADRETRLTSTVQERLTGCTSPPSPAIKEPK